MNRLRASLTAFVGLLLTVVMVACAQIPLSGSVQEGSQQDNDSVQDIRYFPSGPEEQATREEIVQGFIDAGTGGQNDYAIAREYLTEEAAAAWQPEERVLVSDGQASMKSGEGNDIVVSVPVYGHVDHQGVYAESVESRSETLQFTLVQENEEWRISAVPDGIVLIQQAFNDLFEPETLVFLDGQRRYTSPDLRWFPDNNQTITRVVEELLLGPAAWMRPGQAVVSAFPNDTELLNPVQLNGSTAVVNFSEAVSNTSANALSLMRLQLEQSLAGFSEISNVEIQVNGARLDVSLPSAETITTSPQVNSSPLVQQGDNLGYLSGGTVTPPEGAENVLAEVERIEPIRGALSAFRGTVALLTAEGTYAMRFSDQRATFIDGRGGQIEPALDNWDWVWTQSTTAPGLYLTKVGDHHTFELALPAEISREFVSHQVSRDGTRIAFLYETSDGVELAISPIVRDDNGTPVELGEPLTLALPGEQPNDVAWVDSNSVALLIGSGEGTTDVRLYEVGGSFTSLGGIPSAMQTAGSNTLAGMRVVDRQGTLYAPRGTRWQASDVVVTFLYAQL